MTNKEKVLLHYRLTRLLKLLCACVLIGLLFASVSVNRVEAAEHKLKLLGPVNERQYEQAKPIIDKIQKGDTVYIQIGGPGGSMMYGLEIMRLLTKVESTKVCGVGGYAASMSAFYLMMCDKIHVRPIAKIMYHMPYVPGENGEKIRSPETTAFGKWVTELLNVDKLLPPKALEHYYNGKDIWMTGADFTVLFNKLKKANTNKVEVTFPWETTIQDTKKVG